MHILTFFKKFAHNTNVLCKVRLKCAPANYIFISERMKDGKF